MGQQRHKRKKHRFVLLGSDAVNAGVEQIKYHPWGPWIVIVILCALIGAGIGYFYYTDTIRAELELESSAREEQIARLEEEKSGLEKQIVSLNETVEILSNTVNQKTQNENQLSEKLEKQTLPTEFPLTGTATMETAAEGDPMCIFIAAQGAMVVATAGGTVTAVNDDAEYGHNVWVDHGNGYVTIYRNSGEVKVKQGEMVTQGTTLYLINEGNSRLGYQMMRDGVYIDPMEMLAISG